MSFRPTSTLSTSTIKVVTSTSTAPRAYALAVKGTAAGITRTVNVTLTVT